jgi:hypothetical protein
MVFWSCAADDERAMVRQSQTFGPAGRRVGVPVTGGRHHHGMTSEILKTIMDLAASQQSTITWAQLRKLGASEAMVRRLVRDGLLRRRTAGVYVVAGVSATWQQGAWVATFAHPTGTVAAQTAGGFHELLKRPPLRAKLIVPRGSTTRSKVADIRRSPLDPVDVSTRFGMSVTRLDRTVVDLCGVLSQKDAENVVDSVLTARRTTPGRLLDALDRVEQGPGRIGGAVLRAATQIWVDPILPDSESEGRLLRVLDGWGFPPPRRQVPFYEEDGSLAGIADLAWDEAGRAGLEYDSARHHGPRRWPRDQRLAHRMFTLGYDLRSVDKLDLLPGETSLLRWLAPRIRRAA